jgi:hypothetical protein
LEVYHARPAGITLVGRHFQGDFGFIEALGYSVLPFHGRYAFAERRTPNAERRTPNAERRTPLLPLLLLNRCLPLGIRLNCDRSVLHGPGHESFRRILHTEYVRESKILDPFPLEIL